MEGTVISVMKRKLTAIKRSYFSFLFILIFLLAFTNISLVFNPITQETRAANISDDYDSSTYLSVTTPIPEEPPAPPGPPPAVGPVTAPIIRDYDLQTIDGNSVLNSKIDVNQEYKFCMEIGSDQGWDDIEYIDIQAWFDHGDDDSTYNQTKGGNINLHLRYENTTGTANYSMLWPDDEVAKGTLTEDIESDGLGYGESNYLTLSFTPGYQFRYAPGDGSWDESTNRINDINSWNFMILVTDSGEDSTGSSTTTVVDEFGVNSYSEIVSAGFPNIEGQPGENASTDSSLTIKTRSNIEYSLSVDVETFYHEAYSEATLSNETIWVKGGDQIEFANFNGTGDIFLYGSSTLYHEADNDNVEKVIDDIDYKCNIPVGQIPGNYSAKQYYNLRTQTNS